MALQTVKLVSECFVRPQHDLSLDAKQPIYFTPYELAFLDFNYSQMDLLFAKPPPEHQDFSIATFLDDLRSSLSATLTHFYPLSARLATRKEENPPSYVIYVDPENSPGAKFVHATVDVTVSDILTSNCVPSVVHSFFDLNDCTSLDGHTQPLLSIQVTELTDGIFMGGSMNHLLADGASFLQFMGAWSVILRSKNIKGYLNSLPPLFKRGTNPITKLLFATRDQSIQRPQVLEKFFHFTSAAVSKLKAKANEECNTQNISSLQAVSALLWRCITRVRHQPNNSEAFCKLAFNNRRRVNPPLPDDYFGSPVDIVRGTATVGDLMAHGLGWAALRMHEAVTKHEDAAGEKWVDSWNRNPVVHKRNELYNSNTVLINSSPRFDMYKLDLGLGKAIAARSGPMNKGDGKITMYPGLEGGGSMDVEVCLLPQCMMDLECDEEFICALRNN